MAAIPSREVTSTQVAGITFGFYSDDEIRQLSVKQITSPIVFDNLKNPVAGGLYDPALGPHEQSGRCATCKQGYMSCPGHFGHVELAVPVYNPLVFPTLYKLLKCTCLHCFKLKMLDAEVEKYRRRLELLAEDRLVEAMRIQTGGSSATAKAVDSMQDAGEPMLLDEGADPGGQAALQARGAALAGSSAALQARQASHAEASTSGGHSHRAQLTSLTIEAVRDTVTAFFGSMPKSCANCGAELPVIRRDGCLKLFQKPLDAKKVLKNRSKGIDITSALTSSRSNQVEAMETEMAQELQREADARSAVVAEEGSQGATAVQTTGPSLVLDEAAGQMGGDDAQRPRYMTVSEVREVMRRMWARNSALLRLLFAQDAKLSMLGPMHAPQPKARDFEQAFNMFFLQVMPVAPNRVRPVSILGDQSFEHPHNVALTRIINANLDLVSRSVEPAADKEALEENKRIVRQLDLAASLRTWLALQGHVNSLLDSSTASQADVSGIRQQLEKKEGLFRKNMMGKRVNFAARSVISPDPYLAAGEIGVPPYFATRLSYPERVTPWNVQELREMVIRGAHEHPGAVAVEDELGRVILLHKLPRERREATAKLLLAKQGSVAEQASRRHSKLGAPGRHGGGKIVYRHLRDGDLMLTNRQPTLHRPGLMAHRARVLKGERVIRMHYANCATFNADFDGDEINLHLPQDHLGRAEGYGIVHADEQYIVPTDGKPVRGLIQDHVVAGVKLTKHDTFLPRSDFMQLVYACCSPARPGLTDQADLLVPPPTIWKPEPLWTGKQVITTVLAHFTRGMPPLTVTADAKVPGKHWSKGGTVERKRRGKKLTLTFPESNEGQMVVHKGELVSGILDKAVFGKFGLVHAVQDLYGNAVAGSFISALSRLLTSYLQMHGFTCGFDDLLLLPEAEEQRAAMLETAETAALHASARFVGEDIPQLLQGGLDSGAPLRQSLVPADAWSQARSEVQKALAVRYRTSKDAGPKHDAISTGVMHPLSSDVVKACLPDGLVKPFPINCLGLMTTSGAKGSNVNFSQISALLGQQELEGRRVPRMASGKTLPCFQPFDPGARSGGFVGDRFLTGLRPQEYYFHCMAGREGLVDTTVKTSRSGYLQRCLVKNLEPLRIHYDHTVRDDCDGSVVQFAYGEDGLDVTKKSFMKEFGFLARNAERFAQQVDLAGAKRSSGISGLSPLEAAAQKRNRQRQRRLAKGQVEKANSVAPVSADFPITALGVTSEAFQDSLRKYVRTNPDMALDTTMAVNMKRKQEVGERAPELLPRGPEGFSELMDLKFLQGLAAPGEAVGVLAAQSVGEPSTQMTLNTFHMAGRGEANVTLGIPRLRELLMTAAKSIKTPVMTLPLLPHCTRADAETLAARLRRLRLAEVTEEIEVEETYIMNAHGLPCREYCIRLRLTDPATYPPDAGISFEQVVEAFNLQFRLRLVAALKKEFRRLTGSTEGVTSISTAKLGEEEGVTKAIAEGADEGGRAARKSEKEEEDENAEVDGENQEGKLAWAGGRKEEATYEAGDAEDKAIAAAAQKAAQQEDLGPDEEGEEDGAGALVPSQGEEGAGEEEPVSRPGKQGKSPDAGMQTSTSVDEESHACEARVSVGLASPKLLMLKLVEQVAAETVVKATPGIDRCYVLEKKKDEPGAEFRVQTDGISFEGAFANDDLVDVNQVTCNDVGAVLRTFGVEAARRTIVAEVGGVFGAYGIGVDPRHLSLMSDHMTRQGGYRAMNRMGIEASASPFLKVTFETAATFLMDATLKGATDDLASPASRIVAGRVVDVGTGCMELIQQLKLEE